MDADLDDRRILAQPGMGDKLVLIWWLIYC